MPARKISKEQHLQMKTKHPFNRRDLRKEEGTADYYKGGPCGRGDPTNQFRCSSCRDGDHKGCEHLQLIHCSCYRWKHKPQKGAVTRESDYSDRWVDMETGKPVRPNQSAQKKVARPQKTEPQLEDLEDVEFLEFG
jgi:hypothetical protein